MEEKVKRLEAGRKKGQQRAINERLENFRGTDEKNYWKYLKILAGLKKEKEELPEEVQIDERVIDRVGGSRESFEEGAEWESGRR